MLCVVYPTRLCVVIVVKVQSLLQKACGSRGGKASNSSQTRSNLMGRAHEKKVRVTGIIQSLDYNRGLVSVSVVPRCWQVWVLMFHMVISWIRLSGCNHLEIYYTLLHCTHSPPAQLYSTHVIPQQRVYGEYTLQVGCNSICLKGYLATSTRCLWAHVLGYLEGEGDGDIIPIVEVNTSFQCLAQGGHIWS